MATGERVRGTQVKTGEMEKKKKKDWRDGTGLDL